MTTRKKSAPFPIEKLSPKHQAEARAQMGRPRERRYEPGKDFPAPKFPTHKARKRKQQGRDETQVHRDVRGMIKAAWPDGVTQEEYQFQLCEGHSYTVDFRTKAEGEVIWTEAKGAHTWEDSRVKLLWAMTQLRWAFFIWAKKHEDGHWTFEVWHAGSRLKLSGKYQNPKSMVECAGLIRDYKARADAIAERCE